MNKIKLFCLPYAGGSAIIYDKWKHRLSKNLELRPIELAGRGSRMNEPLYKGFDELINDVFQQIRSEIANQKYALFGHSLGALICYEIIEKITENHLPKPEHVFFSGRTVPHINSDSEDSAHLLNEEEFKKRVIDLGGTPPEFFDHPELAKTFIPILKNDFKISNSYEPEGKIKRYDGNITIFLGKDDEGTAEQFHGWKDYTSKLCNIVYCNGGHFFLHSEMEVIAHFINQTLSTQSYFPSC